MEKTLNCEGYKVDYGNLIIKKKREAYFTKNGIEMTPMQFEAPHVIIKQKDDMYGYVTEPGNVDFMDSRIPKLVKKQIEQQELEETQNRMRQE